MIVVLVVVGFQYLSISRLGGFRIIRRSRKFMQLLFFVCGIKLKVWVYLVYVFVDGIRVYMTHSA